MDCGIRAELQQKLVMTPQLCQAIAILQLSSLELASMVEQELLENPALEIDDEQAAAEEQQNGVEAQFENYAQWAEYLNNDTNTDQSQQDSDFSPYEKLSDNVVSLADHLELQLDLIGPDKTLHVIGLFLIGCIDDNGYLRISVDEAARVLGEPVNQVELALNIIQSFEPEGVGARSLSECLCIQLKQRNITDRHVEAIVKHYLEEVSKGRYKVIAEKLGCTPHDVQLAVDFIRTLNPRPGQGFGQEQSGYILPDITVERINGQYHIVINDTMVPRLRVSAHLSRLGRECDPETRRFVEGRVNAAIWVVKSIEQRRQTLYKVMEAIIKLQREFFDYSPKFIKPLTMKKIAEVVGIHESTVSRATANKYVATSHGVFSLRSFFSTGVAGTDGDDVAVASVKRELRKLIDEENGQAPYSDQILTDCLKQKGMIVSRRTIAKYREEMGIASSSKRRRY
ncbi:RNA polymerase sigma-54 factor 1 [bioreactor metagenome]|uniref:RNA polymerase sigma-54 factor 1 n=1 Tax=bioreactor metagenome TaxID=1076179 RepID=A0A644TLV0_9ZZZZ|nr:RNA polymerase factor sigma-54 [Negativicutes bacterium]